MNLISIVFAVLTRGSALTLKIEEKKKKKL